MTIGQPRKITAYPIAEGVLDDPAQAAARAARDTAELALTQAQDDLALVDGEVRALEAQLRFLGTLAGDGMADVNPDRLPQLLATIGAETARLERELHAAHIARRTPEAVVQTRDAALAVAQKALDRLNPFGVAVDVIAFTLDAPSATEGQIKLDYFTQAASW